MMRPAEKLRLVVLSRYDTLGASSRLRTFQYRHHLTEAGLDVIYAPLFDNAYLRALYTGRSAVVAGLRALTSRMVRLVVQSKPHAVWLEKEALPWVPWEVERLFLPRRVPIIADYDDAVFHRYDGHASPGVRYFLHDKIDGVMRSAALVTAGNDYLAERARAAGAQRVAVFPTVVDLDRYTGKNCSDAGGNVGWIGSPTTWNEYVVPMLPELIDLIRAEGGVFSAVGAPEAAGEVPSVIRHPWDEDTEVAHLRAMSVGIMPLADTPWARGKCGYKLIQYMACGVPVVASPVGANLDIVEHGVNGFFASTPQAWRDSIAALLRDPELRRRMGEAGRRTVEQRYCLGKVGPALASEIASIASAAHDRRPGLGR
jgi:glycosyltransferase involved in cell wall biosynthesis